MRDSHNIVNREFSRSLIVNFTITDREFVPDHDLSSTYISTYIHIEHMYLKYVSMS
jgi:hypothetical protein